MNWTKFLSTILLILVLFLNGIIVYAFDNDSINESVSTDTVRNWTFKSLSLLSVNQNALVNWAAGGESSLSGKGAVDYDLKYKKNKFSLDQEGTFALGLVGYDDKRIEKTDDRLEMLLALNHQTSKYWQLTMMTTLKTQLADGYKYPDDSTLISTFFAPGYLTVSFGFSCKPDKAFQLFMSPLSGKMTFVKNEELANKGAYGVKKAIVDSTGVVIVSGKQFLGEVGFNVSTSYKAELMEDINLNTALNLHNNYLDMDVANRWNIDVDIDTRVIFSVNKIFSTILYMHLKYDHNALIPNYEMLDGSKIQVSASPKLQFKESFGLGMTYQID